MRLLLCVAITGGFLGCGGGDGGSASSGGGAPVPSVSLVFSASPIEGTAIQWITPLGNLNPPAHPLPTDHIYFYFANPDAGESPVAKRTAFYAPAAGTVSTVLQNNPGQPDIKVFVQVSNTQTYYLDHLIPDTPIAAGSRITAGQRLGTTGSVYAIDLGVLDSTLTQPFVNPSRYANSDSLHAAAPLGFFSEPLKSQLQAKVQRLGADKDGRIAYDIPGKLAGNWFSEFGTSALSFAYDTYDPAQVRISMPGMMTLTGVFALGAGDALPKDIGVASGKVRLTLTPSRTGPPFSAAPVGILLLQMTDDTHLRIETFALPSTAPDFTGNSRTFLR